MDESNYKDFYGFAAIIADEQATKSLTDRLNAIMDQASVDFGVARTAEIHSYPLFHGTEGWKAVPPRARIAVYRKVIDAVLAEEVTILLRSVDAERLRRRQQSANYPENFPPEQVCFQHILQRVDQIAKARRSYALMIADDRTDRERHRDRVEIYRTEGTPGTYWRTTLENLLDTVHYAPSHRSRMLQAVDVLAFTYQRRSMATDPDPREANIMQQVWDQLHDSGKLAAVGSWP